MLDVPELLREVNVVAVRILKALDLLPESVDLGSAILLYIRDVGCIVDALTRLEYRNEKLACGVVRDGLLLPGLDGIEELERL